jgi:hypothetical protein
MKDAYKFLTELVNQSRYEDCAKQAHETWRATKEEQGWGYGTERDNDLKTNPLMVPFEDLPDTVKGQNNLTPYAVFNFFRNKTRGENLDHLDSMLEQVLEKTDQVLADELGEYVHSHFLAAQLPKGDTIRTRTDLVVYENLDQDTKSWDLNSSLEVVNYLRKEIKKLGGVK